MIRKNRKGLFAMRGQDSMVNVVLYNTTIMKFFRDGVVLNSGGWKTNHTKNCMNDNLPEGYKVFQKNFEWFIRTPEGDLRFEDNMVIGL